MNYTIQFLAEQFYGWYTVAYLAIGEDFPLGALVFWAIQLFR